MTDTTTNFNPIPRLQQIAATIEESGAGTFDAPATAAYYIKCAIKEIERLHRDYSCICNEMRRMMEERDEARREAMLLLSDRASTKEMNAEYKKRGWEYLKENTNV